MWIYLLIVAILILAELLYFKIAGRFNIIDKPNQRSSHTRITIRGGGLVFFLGALLYFFFFGRAYPWFILGLSLIALISFADDIKPRSSILRLLVHFAAMGLMFYQLGLLNLPWYVSILALIVSTGILNAYNFMDGINGITGSYSLGVIAALWYINYSRVAFVDDKLLLVLMLALLVFNLFNFRAKAKCFAGDVGALSIAFTIVFLLGRLIMQTGNFTYILLLALYGVDSVLTIIHRLLLRENIFKPHRKHLYQIMANELNIPHVMVATLYTCLQIIISAGLLLFENTCYLYMGIVFGLLTLFYLLFMWRFYPLHAASLNPSETTSAN
jgi:UDP-N-acetylmuramyl pentapeptide phosphotransferase/UDP-N-acetylglucosamine-1-phosphate transferase